MNASDIRLSPGLEDHVQALRERVAQPIAADAAQERLDRLLASRRAGRMTRPGFRLLFASAALAIVAVLALGLFLPLLFHGQGEAFADVQRHLRDFHTMSMTLKQRMGGMPMPTIRIWADHDGDVHTDVGDTTSVVYNAGGQTVLVLQHANHTAMRLTGIAPDQAKAQAQASDSLDWLQQVQEFKGHATLLAETRTLDGVPVRGWSLSLGGVNVVLWADGGGVPHAVNVEGVRGPHYTQDIKLTLDAPLEPSLFRTDVPSGYRLAQPGSD
ncbi:MAG TPA: hypothetical protein VF651_06065 [Gammaproteobacteria bacterium]